MLEVEDLHTYYGDSYILQGVSLGVAEGQVAALLGRNGVGKTTLLRSIIGLTPARAGRVHLRGQDITNWPPHRIARLGIGVVPQGRRIFSSLTVLENLLVAERATNGRREWTVPRAMSLFPRLRERRTLGGTVLSGGEQQMLAIGRGMVTNPVLLLMDEPTEGLAPVVVRELEEVLLQLKEHGVSILLAEQRFGFALTVADTVYVMSHGKIVHQSSPADLWHNESVKHEYLGV